MAFCCHDISHEQRLCLGLGTGQNPLKLHASLYQCHRMQSLPAQMFCTSSLVSSGRLHLLMLLMHQLHSIELTWNASAAGVILYAQNPGVVHSRRSRLAHAVHDDMLWYLGKPYHTLLSEGLIHPNSHLGLQPLVQVDEVLTCDQVRALAVCVLQLQSPV